MISFGTEFSHSPNLNGLCWLTFTHHASRAPYFGAGALVSAGDGVVAAGALVASAGEETSGIFVDDVSGMAGFEGGVAGVDGGKVGTACRPGCARLRSNALVVR